MHCYLHTYITLVHAYNEQEEEDIEQIMSLGNYFIERVCGFLPILSIK